MSDLCRSGHEMTTENTHAPGKANTYRCRACARGRMYRWRLKNQGLVQNQRRRSYVKDRVAQLARARQKRLDDPEPLRAATRKWFKDHPERAVEYARRYKMRKRGVEVEDYGGLAAIRERDGGLCAYCGGPGQSIDHVIPVVHGGPDVAWNVVLACRSCNSSKRSQGPEWIMARLGLQ